MNEVQPPVRKTAPMDLRGALLALFAVALWSGNPVAVRFSNDTLPPLFVAGIRFLLASITMALWCARSGEPFRLRRDQFASVWWCSVLMFLQIGSFAIGVWLSNASHTTLLLNSFPLGVAMIEHYVTRADRLNLLKTCGIGLASVGVLLVFLAVDAAPSATGSGDQPSLWGDLILLFSAGVLAVKVVYTRRAVRRTPAGTLILWHDVLGGLMLLAASSVLEQGATMRWTWTTCAALAYQGFLVAGLCFGIQAYLLSRHEATQVSVFNFATPLLGVFLAVQLRHDPLSPWLIVSGLLVAAGITLVNRGGATGKPSPAPSNP